MTQSLNHARGPSNRFFGMIFFRGLSHRTLKVFGSNPPAGIGDGKFDVRALAAVGLQQSLGCFVCCAPTPSLKKLPGTHRHLMTQKGHPSITPFLLASDATSEQLNRLAV